MLLFSICYMPLPGMLFHPSWHTSIPPLCLAITTHLKIYFTWFFQPKMDCNDTEYRMCFINSLGINTLAGNLSVSPSHASLNFTVITMVCASEFSTKCPLAKHAFFFPSKEKDRWPKCFYQQAIPRVVQLFNINGRNISNRWKFTRLW